VNGQLCGSAGLAHLSEAASLSVIFADAFTGTVAHRLALSSLHDVLRGPSLRQLCGARLQLVQHNAEQRI